jgi:UDP-glucose 4-epimerase
MGRDEHGVLACLCSEMAAFFDGWPGWIYVLQRTLAEIMITPELLSADRGRPRGDLGAVRRLSFWRVLITGGAGYVGSHCAKALAIAGHDGVVFDSLVHGHREFVRWGPFVAGDIRDSTERATLAPINPYGFSKVACERMMDDFGAAYDIKSIRLRYFNAAGGDPDGDVGEDHNPETHLIPLVLDAAIGRRPAIQVFGSDYLTADGTAVRDYVHVSDLAMAHVKALNYLLQGGETMALNLGTGRGVSVAEVIAGVEKVTGRTVPIVKVARRRGDPAILVADPSMARERLLWATNRSDLDDLRGN